MTLDEFAAIMLLVSVFTLAAVMAGVIWRWTLFAKIRSRFLGLRVGQKRYTRALPHVSGPPMLLAPPECWEDKERARVRLHYREEIWDGWEWRFSREVTMRPKLPITQENQRWEEC